jgi:alpha-tubulin suppressor-like RCC1 family protein/fibronectin type 3 domain-containing protein
MTLYFASDNGGYAADAAADPTSAAKFHAPAGAKLSTVRPVLGQESVATYADGVYPGNVATPTFQLPVSNTDVSSLCVDMYVSKYGGTSPDSITLSVNFQLYGSGGGSVRTTSVSRPYSVGQTVRFTALVTPPYPIPLSQGPALFIQAPVDTDQGVTLHYGSIGAPSSVVLNPAGGTCQTNASPVPPRNDGRATFVEDVSPAGIGDSAGEPGVVADWPSDTVVALASTETTRFDPATSEWTNVSAPITSAQTRDPYLAGDSQTGRVWAAQLLGDCSALAISDEAGSTWTSTPRGCGPLSGVDHEALVAGVPDPGATRTGSYPEALYYCANGFITANCARSDDGGTTFGPALPVYNLTACTTSHGKPRVSPDGVLALPVRDCGGSNAVVTYNAASGATGGTVHKLPGSVTENESDPAIAFDSVGRLYAAYEDDIDRGSSLRFARSDNGGFDWTTPVDLGRGFGLANVKFPTVLAGDNGLAAVVFLGSPNAGDDQGPAYDGLWHVYVAMTSDAGAHWQLSSPAPDDLVQRGCISMGGTTSTTGCRNLLDFISADLTRDGSLVIAIADGCGRTCEADATPSTDRNLVLVRQTGGLRLFGSARTARPAPVAATGQGRDKRNLVTWTPPNDHGAGIDAYHVYRGLSSQLSTLQEIATLNPWETSYVDTDVTTGVTYYYAVSAHNALGLAPRLTALPVTPYDGGVPDPTMSTVSIDRDSVIADGSDPATVTVTLRDNQDRLVTGRTVSLAKASGPGAPAISPAAAVSDTNGNAVFTVRSTTAGAVVLQATDLTDNVALTQTVSTTFVPAAASGQVSTLTADVPSVDGDGQTGLNLTVTMKDANGNPTPDRTVSVAQIAGAAASSITPDTAETDDTGRAYFVARSATLGTATFRATDVTDGVTVNQTATATFVVPRPSGLSGAGFDGQVQLSWSAPEGGPAPTGYHIYRDGTQIGTTGSTTFTAPGLTNGTSYGFTVSSYLNGSGDSARTASITVTPIAAPATPSGLSAAAGNASVSLTWSALSSTADRPVSGYRVYVDGSGTPYSTTSNSSMTVNGLSNSVSHAFTVTSYNDSYESAQSAPVSATPLPAPNTPSGLTATAGNSTVALSWTAPSGGTPVTGYHVYQDNVLVASVGTTSYTARFLTNNVTYSFQVSAYHTSYGESARTATASATPLPAPSPPTGLGGSGRDTQVLLSWTAASGGTTPTGYDVYRDGVLIATVPAGTTTYTASGLVDGTSYGFAVSAYSTSFGEGNRTSTVFVTPIGAPSTPTGVSAVPGNAQVTVSWSPVSSTSARPVSGYRVYADGSSTPSVTTSSTSATVTGLTNSVSHSFTVSTYNSGYESAQSTAVTATPLPPPNAPTGLAVAPGNGQVTLTWTAPSGGSPYSGYYVYRDNVRIATVGSTTYTVGGLTNGTSYGFAVSAYHVNYGESSRTGTVTAVPTVGCFRVSQVSAYNAHAVALRSDGTAWAWGYNGDGELGDGTLTDRWKPVRAGTLTGIIAVAAGSNHSLALRNDGTVWAWGLGGDGELGNGSTANHSTPVQVSSLTGITAIAAGAYHNLALRNDGTVWAWGYGGDGALGNGSLANRLTPVQVTGLTSVTAISAGDAHSFALRSDGTVRAWGANTYGQLGDGTTATRTTAVQVSGLTSVTAIGAGAYYGVALRSDGTVRTWGHNDRGQLGDGTENDRTTAAQVSGVSSVSTISAGYSHVLILKTDGTLWAWGDNVAGEIGNGSTSAFPSSPTQVTSMPSPAGVEAGLWTSYALRQEGSVTTLWAWGSNSRGDLGNGSTTDSTSPVNVGC